LTENLSAKRFYGELYGFTPGAPVELKACLEILKECVIRFYLLEVFKDALLVLDAK
jgi:hypothetical protein